MSTDEQYMTRCFELARMGLGHVAPNPIVGAVIVHQNKVIGEGYHERYGEAHAEVNAVASVENQSILSECTIYVSLEPCAHFGKTPPCADLIVKHKFKRVVIGCSDSFDQVDGKGVKRLRDAGIDVTIGVLEEQAKALNAPFFTFHEKKRPYVFLKWAQTSNGRMDQGDHNQSVHWISQPEIQSMVHLWRSQHAAILIGKNTVKHDNPSLTVRRVAGNNPIRVILDSNLELEHTYQVFDKQVRTIVFNLKKTVSDGIELVQLASMSPLEILNALHALDIQSIMIEGGRSVLQSFLDSGLWDEACVITGQHQFKEGTLAPQIQYTPVKTEKHFGDTLNWYKNS